MMRVYLTRPGAQRATANHDGRLMCKYETLIDSEVHRCAIGCLLTPSTLSSECVVSGDGDESQLGRIVALRDFMGGFPSLIDNYSPPELADVDSDFLDRAQVVHDTEAFWMGGKFDVAPLDSLAAEFGLTVVVDEPVRAPREEEVLIV